LPIRSSCPEAKAATITGMSEKRKTAAAAFWISVALVVLLVG
jgi:hypothetical protein